MGVVRIFDQSVWLGSPNPDRYFRPKNLIFQYPFSDVASKIHTHLQSKIDQKPYPFAAAHT